MKLNGIRLIFSLALMFIVLTSCENYSEAELYEIEECDTVALTWDTGISQIFDKYCVPCHKEALYYYGVRHDSYEEELKVLSDGGKRLRSVINHEAGYEQMPYEKPKLSKCNIEKIETWLDNGAPKN